MKTRSGRDGKAVRIGLAGYGKHGQWAVYPAIKGARGVELAAVADLSADNLALRPDAAVPAYTDYRLMLRTEKLDALYVATPVESHAVVTLAGLRAGLHVVVEKPMAPAAATCRRMINAARQKGLLLAVDFELRYAPAFRKVREWIGAGYLGQVGAVHFDQMWDGHKNFGALAERRRRFCDSSGTLDCGIHKLDLIRYFLGGGKWRDIRAYGAWFGEQVRYAPHIAIQARLDRDVLVTFNSSFAFTAYIRERASYAGLAIVGSKGVITMSSGADGQECLRLTSEARSETFPCEEKGHAPAITQLVEDFARAIRSGRGLPPEAASGEDGMMAVLAVEKANASACGAG